jgi:hypothetical protein
MHGGPAAQGPPGRGVGCDNSPMIVEHQVPLQPHNSFGIVARARELLRVRSEDDLRALLAEPGRAAGAKFVLGGLIIAFDENHNIMIFNDRCEKLQMLPYGKRAMDAVASDTHIFIGMYHNKVLILERKFPFTVVSKVDTDKKILCMCRNELHEIRVCGEDELSFYINEHTFEKKFTKFSSPYFTIV